MKVKPRHPECQTCVHFNKRRVNRLCLPCGSGENFEEKIAEATDTPADHELMTMYESMTNDDDC